MCVQAEPNKGVQAKTDDLPDRGSPRQRLSQTGNRQTPRVPRPVSHPRRRQAGLGGCGAAPNKRLQPTLGSVEGLVATAQRGGAPRRG